MSQTKYQVDRQIERQKVLDQLRDPQWWIDNKICAYAAEAVVGDRVMVPWFDRYSTRIEVYEVTKVARKWRTIVDVDPRYRSRENRFFLNELIGGRAQIDPGDGRGSSMTIVYGQIDYELKLAEDDANAAISAAGLKFEYSHGRAWGPKQRIMLAGFLNEIGMVPE